MSKSLNELYASTPLFGSNAAAVEQLYEQYLENRESVPPAWRDYFDTLGDAETEIAHSEIRADLLSQAEDGGRKTRVQARAGAKSPSGEKQRTM